MTRRILVITEILFIIICACIPLFNTFPYRVNIFLSWEGAYRISEGQVPFKDFGIPLGGMYWVIPAIFFKIFGPSMITLVKAQVFINVIAGLSFRSILSNVSVKTGIRFVSVILFCISYSLFNFWPWYNHTVIVYELVALAFLLKYLSGGQGRFHVLWLIASACFVCFSFLTKQDGGGLAFVICCALLAYHCFIEKKWMPLLIFTGSFIALLGLIILSLSPESFGYWFNHGQPPHTARVSIAEILNEFMASSQWIKFYILLIVLLLIVRYKKPVDLWNDKKQMIFLLLTLAILCEAAIFQVTSYTPPDNNIFYHSFAFAFILGMFSQLGAVDINRPRMIILCTAGVLLWWSGSYWKYIDRVVSRVFPAREIKIAPGGENIVNRQTYVIHSDTTEIPMHKWIYSGLKSFDKIYMPPPTVEGIHRLMNMDLVKKRSKLKVLNMSELTPLAVEIPYELEKNPEYPLWYHLGVGMFNRQAVFFENRVRDHYYDLVLFEYVPALNNFYPFRVRDSLKVHYTLIDSFPAPRRGDTRGNIEVYVKP
jgi:hypothetical protein